MKRSTVILFMGIVLMGTSCKKYFDINNNPNQATSATPQLLLPQALTSTGNTLSTYNNYGAQLVGYMANAGGYGGFGTSITYNFAASDFSGLWSSTYDNLEDYQAIINQTATQLPTLGYYNAVARIMRAHDFALLVDAYNDIPYVEALQGISNLTPAYTSAATIYANLADQLDSAVALINSTAAVTTVPITKISSSIDVLFGADMKKWKQLANTIKLRLMVRGGSKVTFKNTSFSSDGFLTNDALVNPGFTRDNNRQNPSWNSWGFAYTGGDANKAWIPTTFILGYYDGTILSDEGRGSAAYYQFPATGTNQLGYESVDNPKCPSGSFWYSGSDRGGTSAGNSPGILKGPNAGFPIITAAESYFLQAEAAVRGIISGGDAKALFNSGIAASFDYLYKLPSGLSSVSASDLATLVDTYQTDNDTSPLVNFDLATTNDQKIEAIITQKYIALNFVNSQEPWNEYRRTGYPKITNGSADPNLTFASTQSLSTRADKLPARILYPSSEGSYNPRNVPKGINVYSSLIFWAK